MRFLCAGCLAGRADTASIHMRSIQILPSRAVLMSSAPSQSHTRMGGAPACDWSVDLLVNFFSLHLFFFPLPRGRLPLCTAGVSSSACGVHSYDAHLPRPAAARLDIPPSSYFPGGYCTRIARL